MKEFDLVLDICLDRLARGDSIEACLEAYPEHADRLRRMLVTACGFKKANTFKPGESAKNEARRKFTRAKAEMEKTTRRSPVFGLAYWPAALAVTAAILVISIVGYNALQPGVSSYIPVSVPVTSNEGNFVFLISDDVNAIADFESVNVTINKVGLLTDAGWIEFEPEVKTVELALLPGEKTQAIWRGNLQEGHYSKVFIYVSHVEGILKETGKTVDIKLPGNKMQINSDFDIRADSVTGFVFDLTVISKGNSNNGARYILKPQLDESGASSYSKADAGKDKGNGNGNDISKKP